MVRTGLFIFATASLGSAQTYQLDSAHSSASFTVKHMMVTNVTGLFSNVKGTIVYDEKNLSKSSVEATIDVASVNTNEPKRDKHLRSPDFFDVEKFPAMTFKSIAVRKAGAAILVDGNLTMHGVSKPVTLSLRTARSGAARRRDQSAAHVWRSLGRISSCAGRASR